MYSSSPPGEAVENKDRSTKCLILSQVKSAALGLACNTAADAQMPRRSVALHDAVSPSRSEGAWPDVGVQDCNATVCKPAVQRTLSFAPCMDDHLRVSLPSNDAAVWLTTDDYKHLAAARDASRGYLREVSGATGRMTRRRTTRTRIHVHAAAPRERGRLRAHGGSKAPACEMHREGSRGTGSGGARRARRSCKESTPSGLGAATPQSRCGQRVLAQAARQASGFTAHGAGQVRFLTCLDLTLDPTLRRPPPLREDVG